MFKDLEKPVQTTIGWYIITSEGVTGWYIITIGKNAGWLTRNGIIETSTVPIKDYYFDSKLEAHEAALEYYYKHRMSYPYYNELQALRRTIGKDTTKNDVSESQIMEFI